MTHAHDRGRTRGGTKTLLVGVGVALVLVIAAYVIAVGGFGVMRGSEGSAPGEGGGGGGPSIPYAPASLAIEAPSTLLA